MATFKDNAGREWAVAVDVLQLRRVREATGFELGKLLDDNLRRLRELGADPELLCRVLFALCSEQAGRIGVSEEQFLRGVAGDALEAAFDAFMMGYADFCPSQQRKLLTTLARKQKEHAATMSERAMAALEAATPSGSVTGSPESSASIPPG